MQFRFPREHPFNSHTSQFAIFPDFHPHSYLPYTSPMPTTLITQPTGSTQSGDKDGTKRTSFDIQTQTLLPGDMVGVPRPPVPYFVPKKASEYGVRVERRYLNSSPGLPVVKESREMLWDIPRSQRHKVCSTSVQ